MDEKARRDDVIARELSRALRAQGTAASGPHLDAEAVAAWTERRLDAAESESVEIHLASCTDCQAIVATLARTAPEPADAPGAGWWSSLRRPWLVPAAAAVAAALVLWVVQPGEPPAPRLESTLARSDAPVAPAAPAAAETQQFARAEPTPEASQLAPRDLEAESKLLRKAEPGREAAPPAAVGTLAEPAFERQADGASAARPAAAPPSASPRPEAAGGARADAAVVAEAPAVDAQANRKESVTITGQTPAPPPAERREQGATTAQQRSLNDAARFAAALRAAELSVTSADGRARWRRSGAALEFAPDATAAFTAVTLPLDASALVAGSSPGGTVCWLAGRGGVVLVSTNGTQFTRVGTPTTLDLVQVAATDARTAVVTAADGRRFRTADQGRHLDTPVVR